MGIIALAIVGVLVCLVAGAAGSVTLQQGAALFTAAIILVGAVSGAFRES